MLSKVYDMHTHSRRSFDTDESLENLCLAAISRGLAGIALTDHLDFGYQMVEDWQEQLAGSISDAWYAAEMFRGRLDVLAGVEIGQPLQDKKAYEATLNKHSFDVILMSLHNASGRKDYARMDYEGLDLDKLLDEYLEELYEMAINCDFDVLTHIGYPLRYIYERPWATLDIRSHQRGFDTVLERLAQRGKALEVNLSWSIRGRGDTTPTLEQLKRFKELGGRYVTIGSDAHVANNVGGLFEKGIALVKQAGFSNITHYKSRAAVLTPIADW